MFAVADGPADEGHDGHGHVCRGEGGLHGVDADAGQDAHEEGEDDLLGEQGEKDGQERRENRPEAGIRSEGGQFHVLSYRENGARSAGRWLRRNRSTEGRRRP